MKNGDRLHLGHYLLIALIAYLLLNSCTASKDVTRATDGYFRVAWCTQEYVYIWKDSERTKMDSILNFDNDMLCPNDYIVCKYNYMGGLR